MSDLLPPAGLPSPRPRLPSPPFLAATGFPGIALTIQLHVGLQPEYSHSAALQLHSMVWCTVVCHGPYHRGRLADRGMGSGGVEEWRSEGVEEWKSGGVEEWRSEGVEE